MPAAVKVERRTWRIAAEPGAPKKATVARFNIVASAVWSAEMVLRVSKKTTFEILINKQIYGSLTNTRDFPVPNEPRVSVATGVKAP